jgi:hypothetical protein
MKVGVAIVGFFLCLATAPLGGQSPAAAASALPDSAAFSNTFLGRFETIAVGSFPLSLFYMGFAFDLASWISNGGDALYAPWPFKSDKAPALLADERLQRLGAAAILSLGIAVLDAILLPGAIERRAVERGNSVFPVPLSAPGDPAPAGAGSPIPGAAAAGPADDPAGGELDSTVPAQ